MSETVYLWDLTPGFCEKTPRLDCYLPQKRESRIAVVIFPGGGYGGLSAHEGTGYAEFLNAHGIAAFVCWYRVSQHRFPLPLLDARRAIRYVRAHAEEFDIDKDQVYVMGSSAGGHLAALISTYYEPIPFEHMDAIDEQSAKPNGQILCYPVIKLLGKGITHLDSGKNLLGERQAELGEELSPDQIVTPETPKAFIWHTFNDPCVSAINSLDYAKALWKNRVDTELHIYPRGDHGLGLAPNDPHVAQWSQALLRWLQYCEANKEQSL